MKDCCTCLLVLVFLFFQVEPKANNRGYIVSPNEGVITVNDFAKFYQGATELIPALDNDLGLADGVKSFRITKEPKNGTFEILQNNAVSYTPRPGYVGADQMEYEVCSNSGSCGMGTIFIDVIDFDYKPQPINDTVMVINIPSLGIEVDVLQNDLTIFDEPVAVTVVANLNHGQATVNANHTITPVFDRAFSGVDSLVYEVCDADMDCATAKVIFTVRQGSDNDGMFVPSGISPNGDGLNDFFIIPDLSNYPLLEIKIFNPWGQLVYDNSAYGNKWDGIANTGSYKGMLLPSGTYYYVLTVASSDLRLTGFVYISR